MANEPGSTEAIKVIHRFKGVRSIGTNAVELVLDDKKTVHIGNSGKKLAYVGLVDLVGQLGALKGHLTPAEKVAEDAVKGKTEAQFVQVLEPSSPSSKVEYSPVAEPVDGINMNIRQRSANEWELRLSCVVSSKQLATIQAAVIGDGN